jgi:hypothetical protein
MSSQENVILGGDFSLTRHSLKIGDGSFFLLVRPMITLSPFS